MPGNRAGEIRRDDIQAKRQLGPERYREGCRLLRPMVFPIHEHLTHQAPPPRTRGALSSLRIACDRAIIRDMRAKIKGFARICPSYADFWCMGNCVKATCSEHRETTVGQAVRKWERARPAYWCMGNCVKVTCSEHRRQRLVKRFGSGSGHGPLIGVWGIASRQRAASTGRQ